ncbi:fibrinogen-like protein 1 [Cynoglossus semilaevis]|uniref:fibrinogen-like protein 1 n=1 Tax=Cynoglossus semilaevis TaxID=244447 RepID=UPI0004964975|nr:fibrinogen-like protein 1 [Cynoglossus semilaevis]
MMDALKTLLLLFFLHTATSLPVPEPCEQKVVRLEEELRGLVRVISDQHHYILELHRLHSQQLENIPNSHLGPDNLYKDCSQVFADGNVATGIYVVRPDGSPTALTVYCDMSNGGGWTVFQRRRDGSENFDRAWVEYKQGFGDLYSPDGEFWLGNEPIHHLTSQGNYDLHIDLEDFDGNHRYAEYKNFRVDGEKDQFQLHLGEYSGDAGDALATVGSASRPSGVKFSTFDHMTHDRDKDSDTNCLSHSLSLHRCDSGNLNGHYYNGPYQAMTSDGVVWYTWHGLWYSIKSVVMMVRAAELQHPLVRQLGNEAPGGAVDSRSDQ